MLIKEKMLVSEAQVAGRPSVLQFIRMYSIVIVILIWKLMQ